MRVPQHPYPSRTTQPACYLAAPNRCPNPAPTLQRRRVQNRLSGLAKRWAEVNELLSVTWRLRELEAGLRGAAGGGGAAPGGRGAEMRPLMVA